MNALRHNGPGVRLRLAVEAGDRVTITARNALKGTPRAATGYGLAGLAEQAAAAGGALTHGAAGRRLGRQCRAASSCDTVTNR